METVNPFGQTQPCASEEAATLFVSLELSRARWLATSLSPGGSKISRHFVAGGNSKDLLRLLADLRMKAERHIGASVSIVTIQEIGFDGFWIRRILVSNSVPTGPFSASARKRQQLARRRQRYAS
jgi:transposase